MVDRVEEERAFERVEEDRVEEDRRAMMRDRMEK